MPPEHVDLRSCEHAPIPDQGHSRQAEPPGERPDLVGDGLGVTGVAGIDLDGHRPPLGIGQGTVDDDRQSGLAVAVVAEAGQRAGLALVVAAGDVVEDQRSVAQMPSGRFVLDRRLASQEPVHGVVGLILAGVGDVPLFGRSKHQLKRVDEQAQGVLLYPSSSMYWMMTPISSMCPSSMIVGEPPAFTSAMLFPATSVVTLSRRCRPRRARRARRPSRSPRGPGRRAGASGKRSKTG